MQRQNAQTYTMPANLGGVVTISLVVIAAILLYTVFFSQTEAEARDTDLREALINEPVVAVARAPDGTTLWATQIGDEVIYFPSAKTVTLEE